MRLLYLSGKKECAFFKQKKLRILEIRECWEVESVITVALINMNMEPSWLQRTDNKIANSEIDSEYKSQSI